MKRFIYIIVVTIMGFCLISCGNEKNPEVEEEYPSDLSEYDLKIVDDINAESKLVCKLYEDVGDKEEPYIVETEGRCEAIAVRIPKADGVVRVKEITIKEEFTFYYFILDEEIVVGVIRVIDNQDGGTKRISPIFIMSEYRNRGYAQKAILLAEEIHGDSDWELDTILQEKANCYLYEKMGYYQIGRTEVINDKLTLVFYKKD